MVVVLTIAVHAWRGGETPRSPVLLMGLVTTLIVWQDPIMNWSPYAVYNPSCCTGRRSWPLIVLSPTVEPFIVFGYVMFYFGPYFPADLDSAQAAGEAGPESFVAGGTR